MLYLLKIQEIKVLGLEVMKSNNDSKGNKKDFTSEIIELWAEYLRKDGKAIHTIDNYIRASEVFLEYFKAHGNDIDTDIYDILMGYRNYLIDSANHNEISINTVNARISALNNLIDFISSGVDRIKVTPDNEAQLKEVKKQIDEVKGRQQSLKIALVKLQTETTNDEVITDSEYNRMLKMADKLGMEREKLIIEVLARTGIRIAELEFFTVENLKKNKNKIMVKNKGKVRSVILPDGLSKKLLDYAKRNNIDSGIIFYSRNDHSKMLSKVQIWKLLKRIAGKAKIKKAKIYPHNFRRYYAQKYLELDNANILDLADLLGHSSLETTRLYTRKSTKEQKQIVNALNDLF